MSLAIQKAADTLLPGDTAHIRAGTYNERVINTVYHNGTSGWGGGISLGEDPDVQNIVMRNNIVSQNVSFQSWCFSISPVLNN